MVDLEGVGRHASVELPHALLLDDGAERVHRVVVVPAAIFN